MTSFRLLLRTASKTFAAVFVICASATIAPATAGADQFEFISDINDSGVAYENMFDLLDTAKLACKNLRTGASKTQAVSQVAAGGYAQAEAVIIVQSAVKNLCPDAAS